MPDNRNLLNNMLDLHRNSCSGVFRIERGPEKKQLVLRNGLLAFAESNRPEEHLARILVKLELLPRSRFNEITALMKAGKTSEEAVLALSGLGIQELEKGRREQAIAILASLWAWGDCDMRFYTGDGLARYQTNLGLSLPELLILSARRAISDRLVSIRPSFLEGSFSVAEDFAKKASDFRLNSAESYACSLLHEPINAADLFSLISSAEEKPEELLLSLWLLGLVSRKEPLAKSGDSLSATDSNPIALELEDMLLRFETAGLYEILSIPSDADQDGIQTAYHNLAKQLHPDRFQSKGFSNDIRSKAEKVFTYINEAYLTLKNPTSRALYDEKRLTKESKVEAELKARAAKKSEDEKVAEALYQEGRLLLIKGDFEKAVERLKGSVWLSPENPAYNHYLGAAESAIPRLRKSAEQHLLKALELDKMLATSHLELAKLYIKVMLPRKAELHLQEFMRYDAGNPEAHRLVDELKDLESAAANRGLKGLFTKA